MDGFWSLGGEKFFLSSTMVSRRALKSTQPSIRRILRTLSAILKGCNVKLTTHLHSVFRSNMRWLSPSFHGGETLTEKDKLAFAFQITPVTSYWW